MKCLICDGPEHPAWKAHTFAKSKTPLARANFVKRIGVPRAPKIEATDWGNAAERMRASPNFTQEFVKRKAAKAKKRAPAGSFDRVKYQREYMRKRRAK